MIKSHKKQVFENENSLDFDAMIQATVEVFSDRGGREVLRLIEDKMDKFFEEAKDILTAAYDHTAE